MKYPSLGPIAFHLPETVEDNDFLASEFPNWRMDEIYAKTGIRVRRVVAEDECASDLAVVAAEKLFADHGVDRSTIDFPLGARGSSTACRWPTG